MKKSKFYFILIMICILPSPAIAVSTKALIKYSIGNIGFNNNVYFDSPEEHVTRENALAQQRFNQCLPKICESGYGSCDRFLYSNPVPNSPTSQYGQVTRSQTRHWCNGASSSGVETIAFAFASPTCPVGRLRAVDNYTSINDQFVCDLPDDTPNPNQCNTAGNPINYLTGDKVQVETDYVGRAGLNITRNYLNQRQGWVVDNAPHLFDFSGRFTSTITSDSTTCLGFNASTIMSKFDPATPSMHTPTLTSYCLDYRPSDVNTPSVILKDSDGKANQFFDKGGYFGTSVSSSSTKIIALDPASNNGLAWLLSYESGKRYYFDQNGFLKRTVAKNGDAIAYTYQDKKVFSKANKFGDQLLFTYDLSGKVQNIELPNGKFIVYEYASTDHSKGAALLTSVTLANGNKSTYKYENPDFPLALTGIVDAKGVRYATWEYDAQGRGISSEHAGGIDRFTFDYTNFNHQWYPRVTVTNPLQKKTSYTFATYGGKRFVRSVYGEASTNCDSSLISYDYNVDGSLQRTTDRNGTQTVYTYNNAGQEISRTESHGAAPGLDRTTITEWHPTLNLKTKITEPDRETTYTYDANGLLLNQSTRALP